MSAFPFPTLSIVGSAVSLAVLTLMQRRLSRERPLKLSRQWNLVTACFWIQVLAYITLRPSPLVCLWSAPALICGVALGAVRTRAVVLRIDDEGRLMQRMPAAALKTLLLLLCVRQLLRVLLVRQLGADVSHADFALLAFAFGLVAGGRVELTLRARQLRRPGSAPPSTAPSATPQTEPVVPWSSQGDRILGGPRADDATVVERPLSSVAGPTPFGKRETFRPVRQDEPAPL